MAESAGPVLDVTQENTCAADGGIFYVCKTALDLIRSKRVEGEHVSPGCVRALLAFDQLTDSDVLVPVNMRPLECNYRDLESLIAHQGVTEAADYFLAASMFFELNSRWDESLAELPRELTVSEMNHLWAHCYFPLSMATSSHVSSLALEGEVGGSRGAPQHTMPSAMRSVLRCFYDQEMQRGGSHKTARDLIMAEVNALLERFLVEDTRARRGQPQAPGTFAVTLRAATGARDATASEP
jgi:hypothetical protein